MKCIIYARTATDKKATETSSLEAQEKDLREYAKRNNLEVGKVISEIGSGADANRTGFKKLVREIYSSKYDCILCTSIDRLSRSSYLLVKLINEFNKAKIQIKTLSGDYEKSPEYKLQELLLAGYAQFDSEVRGERIRRALQIKKQEKARLANQVS